MQGPGRAQQSSVEHWMGWCTPHPSTEIHSASSAEHWMGWCTPTPLCRNPQCKLSAVVVPDKGRSAEMLASLFAITCAHAQTHGLRQQFLHSYKHGSSSGELKGSEGHEKNLTTAPCMAGLMAGAGDSRYKPYAELPS